MSTERDDLAAFARQLFGRPANSKHDSDESTDTESTDLTDLKTFTTALFAHTDDH